MKAGRGILTLACGSRRYLDMARALVRSIRLRDPSVPLAVATDCPPTRLRCGAGVVHVPVDPAFGRGVEQKLRLDEYSPFAETLFIDADCLVFRKPSEIFDAFRTAPGFGVIGHGALGAGESHISIRDLREFLGRLGIPSLPVFNGGIYHFTRGPGSGEVFRLAREIFQRRDELGLLPFKAAGAADEPVYAAAMRLAGIEPLPWDGATIMGTALDCFEGLGSIDVVAGRSRFMKLGHNIAPAVIHFNMNAQFSPVYFRECFRLRLGPGFPCAAVLSELAGRVSAVRYRLVRGLGRRLSGQTNFPR